MTARTLTCHVESVEDLTPDVFRVRFAARPEALAHAPGQYLEMKLDDTTWVPFSIANAASDDGVLELHIQHWPERSNSARLRSLLVAANQLELRLPSGECVLDLDDPSPIVLICAGTGFSQMHAMLQAAFARGLTQPIELWWAARERRDLYLESAALNWAASQPNFRYFPVLEEAPEVGDAHHRALEAAGVEAAFNGHLGRIDEALRKHAGSMAGKRVYLSGSPGMVYACVDALTPLGVEASALSSDVFSYAPREPLLDPALVCA